MDHRCLFILISIILYLNKIQCDVKHHPIDFLQPTNDENSKHEELTTTTPKPNDDSEPHGIKKFIVDVKNKFSHLHPVRDVGAILFGSSSDKTTTTKAITSVPSATTEIPEKDKSNIDKIVDSMPSESEDMIRVVTLKKDEHYGKGKAKPKYLTMELEKMNSTEYTESSTFKAVAAGKSFTEDFSETPGTSSTTQKPAQENGSDLIPK